MAIGRGGNNIKLAGQLSGYEIDVYRDGEVDIEDVDLEEFADEIDGWIIDELKAIGCDSRRSLYLRLVLKILHSVLIWKKRLIEEVFRILKAEFE